MSPKNTEIVTNFDPIIKNLTFFQLKTGAETKIFTDLRPKKLEIFYLKIKKSNLDKIRLGKLKI